MIEPYTIVLLALFAIGVVAVMLVHVHTDNDG